MPEAVQSRRSEREEVQSLAVLARHEPAEAEKPPQFLVLVRHFFERFFTNELASAEGDVKTRLVQVACALGLPGLVVSLYLYPVYHLPFHQVRTYWQQAGDHYFYVVYSMVVMALLTVFEWDLLFPDVLDVFILSSLPVRRARLLQARVTAIFFLIGTGIVDSNILAIIVLPAATDPPHLLRFLAAHLLAIAASGVFGASFLLALEGVLLAVLGERLFRKISLWLQGALVVLLLVSLFSWPAVSIAVGTMLHRPSAEIFCFPPFWFLGIYQRILDGPATQPVFAAMSQLGFVATALAVIVAALSYPLAWWRRTRGLIEDAARREGRNLAAVPAHGLLHATLARSPDSRAVWHFIGLNLLRVPRYRMVLVMYGGAAAALVMATVFRLQAAAGKVSFIFSAAGLRATVPMIAFLTVAGLRSTFLAPADQRGRWIFRAVVGRPGLPHLSAARRWVLTWTLLLTLATAAWICAVAGQPLNAHIRFVAIQGLVAIAASLLLTDAFFLNVRSIPFTGAKANSATNLALLLIPYIGFFPAVVLFTVSLEPVIEGSFTRIGLAAATLFAIHPVLTRIHRTRILEHLRQIESDEDEEDFPLRLGLRY